ncbi:hypothetical protein IFR05_010890 [Cadophora sp. M221]|nr:hypothetical protein IFR05_010890 [Cadophora sp. M221]
MDAFISRKKRKPSPPNEVATQPTTTAEQGNKPTFATPDDSETESTDFKLALLSSLHPGTDQQLLLDVLLENDGSVLDASTTLTSDSSPPRKSSSSATIPTAASTAAATGYQSSLSTFLSENQPLSTSPATSPSKSLPKPPKLLSKRGKTLHLYSPSDIETHTPCSIIHNFLPADEANALLRELLLEAETFERSTFKLFDNVVQSPHTACFYVESTEEMRVQKTEYIYNGGRLDDVRQLTPRMLSIAPKVTTAVNASILRRQNSNSNSQKLKHQSPHPWKPNAAFVNCYNGPTESVGYHSDQLTYLGPRAVIGSISLGVAREFRVRRIVPVDDADTEEGSGSTSTKPSTSKVGSKEKEKDKDKSDIQGQIAIHLPHNSLLIMHASMQEEWKHSISPSPSIIPHPISGNRRINITYRDYKDYLHPKFTPRCRCAVPAVLRVVQRKRENWGSGRIGVFTSAVQLLDSIIKLKSFIDNFREAPDEIKCLIEEIELMGMVMVEYGPKTQDGDQRHDYHQPSPLVEKCWEMCGRASQSFEAILRQLDAEIGKRRVFGSWKAVLEKGSVEKMQERLKSAHFPLTTATQIHHARVNHHLHEVQMREIKGLAKSMEVVVSLTLGRQATVAPLTSGTTRAERAFVVKYSYDDRRRPAFETPFSAIVSGVMEQDLFRPATGDLVPEVTNISAAIRIWLQELMDLGINIVDYGQKEKEVQIFGSVNNVFHSMVVYISHDQTMTVSWCEHVYFTLLFNFGPTPCDWKFWCIEHLGDAFGEFWDMVDHPERVIPGSWDESHDVLNEE